MLIYNADVNVQNQIGRTPLHQASFGDHKILKELLNHHADVNLKDWGEETAMMKPSSFGCYKIVKGLLNHHADINIQRCDGSTALMLASKHKHVQVVMEFINHNADVNFQDAFGNTALHTVLLEKVTDTTINIIKLLLSNFTYSEKLNKENKSVIQLAEELRTKKL